MGIAEEAKANTLEEKILEILRKEIGVEIGEEFDVYQNGEKQTTCKFAGNEFDEEINFEFRKSEIWMDIICNFCSYTFEKKPFIPKYKEDYFFLLVERDENKHIRFASGRRTWTDDVIDYGMTALGNVFRSKTEALENNGKLLEKIKKLQKGEV